MQTQFIESYFCANKHKSVITQSYKEAELTSLPNRYKSSQVKS